MDKKFKNIIYLIIFIYLFVLFLKYFKLYSFNLNINFLIFFYMLILFFSNTFLRLEPSLYFILFGFSLPLFNELFIFETFISFQNLVIVNIKLFSILEFYIIFNEFLKKINDEALFVLITFILNILLPTIFIKIYDKINFYIFIPFSIFLFLIIIFFLKKNKKNYI